MLDSLKSLNTVYLAALGNLQQWCAISSNVAKEFVLQSLHGSYNQFWAITT